jgi:hypothetical protein
MTTPAPDVFSRSIVGARYGNELGVRPYRRELRRPVKRETELLPICERATNTRDRGRGCTTES